MNIFVILLIAFTVVVALGTFFYGIKKKGRRIYITSLYVLGVIYAIATGLYYADSVPDASPDESAHIAYVYYLDKTGEIIPTFEDMHIFSNAVMKWSTEPNYEYQESLVNYLCHPPLYYHIMRLAGGFTPTDSDVVVTIDKPRLRHFSLGIYTLGLILLLYIGWSRLSKTKPWQHLLFISVAVNIPMMGFEFCAVTNDALVLLTSCTCILGLIRFCEEKRNFGTYLLIALGISGSLLTKLTAAMLCIVMALVVLIVTMIKERSIVKSLSLKFVYTIPIYVIALSYYVIMYNRYGAITPSLELICSKEYFENTIYYVAENERTIMTWGEYIGYFFNRFFLSWSGIESVYRFMKTYTYSLTAIPYEILWVLPVLFVIPRVRKQAGKLSLPIIAGYVGIVVTFIYQLKSAYGSYLTRGYMGGFASRYYIPFIGIFALAVVFILDSILIDNGFNAETEETVIKTSIGTFTKNLLFNQLVYVISLAFSFLMFYGNLPFFVIHFGEMLQ